MIGTWGDRRRKGDQSILIAGIMYKGGNQPNIQHQGTRGYFVWGSTMKSGSEQRCSLPMGLPVWELVIAQVLLIHL